MFTIDPLDPSLLTVAVDIDTHGVNSNEQLMLYNDSPIGLLLKFADGSVDILPAYWNKDFIIKPPMGRVNFTPYNRLSISSNYPISQLYGTLYEKSEHVPSVNSSMQRGVAVTNSGGIPLTIDALNNQGHARGNQFLTASPSDNPGTHATYAVYIMNDGTFVINDYFSTGLSMLQVLPFQLAGVENVTLGDGSHVTGVNGELDIRGLLNALANAVIAGTLDVSGAISADSGIIRSNGVGNLSSHQFVADRNSTNSGFWGTDTAGGLHKLLQILTTDNDAHLYTTPINGKLKISKSDFSADIIIFDDAVGVTLNVGQLVLGPSVGIKWKTGDTLSGTHTFNGAGSGTYTHGAGGTPYFVTPMVNVVGSATLGYSNITSTQVTIVIGAALAFRAQTFLG